MAETELSARRSTRRATLRAEQKEATRTRLMESAHALFTTQGYATVTIDEITAEVGCSRATFYLHFPAKLDILVALSVNGIVPSAFAFYEDLDQVLETGSRAEFTAWVTRAIEWFQAHKDMFRAWDEATVLEPEFRAIARHGILALPDSMPKYLARWPLEEQDEARLRIELLVTQLERFFTRWQMYDTIDVTAARATQVLTGIWFPALTAPPSASAEL